MASPSPAPEKLNLESPTKVSNPPVVPLNPPKKEEIKAMTEVSKPSFLGRMGAMMGLMNASKFEETNKEVNEEGRLDSASTFKSRRNES